MTQSHVALVSLQCVPNVVLNTIFTQNLLITLTLFIPMDFINIFTSVYSFRESCPT